MKNAFSIIEIVLVILVIGIAALGIVVPMQQVLYNVHKPQVITTATFLAASEAERVMSLDFVSIVDENRDSPQSYGGKFSTYSREARIDSIDTAQPNLGSDSAMDNYKVIEIRVHHPVINYISLKLLRVNY